MRSWEKNWNIFKEDLPFTKAPYNKRNWGSNNHSLCSFYGKLKPAISHFLIETFTSKEEIMLDCFSGSGTLPYEAALNGRKTFGMDINPISVVISSAKVKKISLDKIQNEFDNLSKFVISNLPTESDISKAQTFGFNKTLKEYFQEDTFKEILNARQYFKNEGINTPERFFIATCLLHILHGNRPYALSRTSHPITPYAPTGEFEYRSLLNKLYQKVDRAYKEYEKFEIIEGDIFHADILEEWPNEIQNVNAIITSPPFFDSTKYYMTNWLRSWFLGWEKEDFDVQKEKFVDTKQKKTFDVYDTIIKSGKERLTKNGIIVFHLGKSHKKDMGEVIKPYAKKYFKNVELFNEDVSSVEKHGVMDKGSVNVHQYLLMY